MHVQAEGSAGLLLFATRDCRALGAPDACVREHSFGWASVGKREAGLTQPPS